MMVMNFLIEWKGATVLWASGCELFVLPIFIARINCSKS